jgi:hypothetical protein
MYIYLCIYVLTYVYMFIHIYTGSAAYVHLSCLNRWRETSNEAHFTCSVCKYAYNIKKTYIADLMMSENGATIFTVLMLFLGVLVIGIVLHLTLHFYLQLDIPATLYSYLEIHPSWRYCPAKPKYNPDELNRSYTLFNDELNDIYNTHKSKENSIIDSCKNYFKYISNTCSLIEWYYWQLWFTFFQPVNIYRMLLCYEFVSTMFDVLVLGISAIGVAGTLSIIVKVFLYVFMVICVYICLCMY